MTTIKNAKGRRLPVWEVVSGVLFFVAAFSVAGPSASLASTDGVQLAARGGLPDGLGNTYSSRYDPLVERIQKALSNANLYRGRADGRMNDATEQAIRQYQKSVGRKVDGRVSEDLAGHIETGQKVGVLLKKLERTREENSAAARRALISNPATRALIEAKPDEVADPTRDFSACFQNPTASCLLAESFESTKAVFKDELRDWALGELLVVQARAGLADSAMASAHRIGDPRLIMVALRDIAEAMAKAGRVSDAFEAAAIIPDPEKQAEAFAAIATALLRCDGAAVSTSLERLNEVISRIEKRPRRVPLICRKAVILAGSGAREAAEREIERAETLSQNLVGRIDREAGYRYVALALAEMGEPDRALDVLKKVKNGADHTPVLVAAANAQAEAGEPDLALETASGIETGRYKAVVLSRIALAQAKAGNLLGATATIQEAYGDAAKIDLPFARDFANSRISLALASIARETETDGLRTAIEKSGDIVDNRLRAHTLWALAAEQMRADDKTGAAATRELALAATEEMKSPLSRVWMFGDIGLRHASLKEEDAAWGAFADGMKLASDIHNAWGRSRALSRMAATLIELTEPLSCQPGDTK